MSNLKLNQNITPFFWFDGKAEEAMELYTSLFPDSAITLKKYWGDIAPFPPNWVMSGSIVINGLKINLFDAGPQFKFNESISLFVSCKTQEEIDTYWSRLSEGGSEGQCGWLKDKFGLSWQIVPEMLQHKLDNGEPMRVGKMMQALGKMKKLNIAELETAYNS
ncbi:MAG TPA: VOC family protein [Cyclobacteriaceae bacterium]|jgi:predicted 3-demethylubiquinone-9 3-methyltransferase (glyoxalase superfamily)|nr:VOC family protein [Cyclobacteriaceae bacterium]